MKKYKKDDPIQKWTRREFVGKGSLAGFSLALVPKMSVSIDNGQEHNTFNKSEILRISPRYYRWHVDPGVEWLESNTSYNYLKWDIPVAQAGLVLLDVWQRHYLKDTEDRSERIIDKNLVPLLQSCRENGLTVIHAPSLNVAKKYPNWHGGNRENYTSSDMSWPPKSFKEKQGEFKKYARPFEPREEERQNLPPLIIHPKVQPLDNETIIGTGNELHQYCRREGILFLFFVGFNTNACMITRDYGALAMSKKGYEILLVRDCTTGMESASTQSTLAQTNNSILFFEMFGQYTVTSGDIMKGFIG